MIERGWRKFEGTGKGEFGEPKAFYIPEYPEPKDERGDVIKFTAEEEKKIEAEFGKIFGRLFDVVRAYGEFELTTEDKQNLLKDFSLMITHPSVEFALSTGEAQHFLQQATTEEQSNLIRMIDDLRNQLIQKGKLFESTEAELDLSTKFILDNTDSYFVVAQARAAMWYEDDENKIDIGDIPIESIKDVLRRHPSAVWVSYEGYFWNLEDLIKQEGLDVFNNLSDEQLRKAFGESYDPRLDSVYLEIAKTSLAQKHNNPDLKRPPGFEDMIATKISSDTIGLFDEYGELKGLYKEKDDNAHQLSDERLFSVRSDMTEEQVHEKHQMIRDVASMQDLRVRSIIEKDFGLNLSKMTLREQVWFVGTLRDTTPDDEKRIQAFIQTYGMDGARVFLSSEFGDEFRDIILALPEKHDEETARSILKQFSEISSLAQTNAEELVALFYKEGKGQGVDQVELEAELLKRAKNLLTRFGKGELSKEEATKQLERANADTVLFASMFKTAFKGKEQVDFKQVQGLEFGSMRPAEISEEEKQEMLQLARQNWQEQIPEVAESILRGLQQKLDAENTDSQFYVLKKDGNVVAFIRFDNRPDIAPGAVYGGSFNVRPDMRGSAIGEAMMRKTIDQVAKEHTIYADVFPEVIAGTAYVEKFGCVIYGVENGRILIKRDDRVNKEYHARQKGVTKQQALRGLGGVETLMFDVSENKQAFLSAIKEATDRWLVGTRYFADKENPNIRYVVLEPELADAGSKLVEGEELVAAAK